MANQSKIIAQEVEEVLEEVHFVNQACEIVAKRRNLPFRTVCTAYYCGKTEERCDARFVLTEDEEQILVAVLRAYAFLDMPLSQKQVKDAVQEVR
mmetsp:Transcript_12466/g.19060  ORF Transcript_12466/g.19060 Transcript_12466/m.19060 type:complete len:95 (-) Transcript_12466:79-363(-)